MTEQNAEQNTSARDDNPSEVDQNLLARALGMVVHNLEWRGPSGKPQKHVVIDRVYGEVIAKFIRGFVEPIAPGPKEQFDLDPKGTKPEAKPEEQG